MIKDTASRILDWLRPSRLMLRIRDSIRTPVQSRKHEWHNNLSDELNAFFDAVRSRRSIDITACRKGEMLHVVAGRHYYDIVVVNPKKNEIAVVTDFEELPKDELWILAGSPLRGESMFHMHTIVVGAGLVIHGLRAGVLETERVDSITICDDASTHKTLSKELKPIVPEKKHALNGYGPAEE